MTIKELDFVASIATVIGCSCEILALEERLWIVALACVFILHLLVDVLCQWKLMVVLIYSRVI